MKEDRDRDQSGLVCKLCYRRFRNAKVLDGHTRNHEDAGLSKIGFIVNADNSSEVKCETPEGECQEILPITNQCKGCGKEFASAKALYGHMRCHPELTKKRSSTKRFKTTSFPFGSGFTSVLHDIQVGSVLEPETEEAAMILLMLSEDAPFLGENDGVKERFAEDKLSVKNDNTTIENGILTIHEWVKPKSEKLHKDHNSNEISSKKNMKYTWDEKTASNKGEYMCKTCYMMFTSRYALGGHTSQHHSAHKSASSSRPKNTLDDITLSTEQEANKERKTHICSTCLKNFESGHALGGHMRTHYTTRTNTSNVNGAAGFKHEESMGY